MGNQRCSRLVPLLSLMPEGDRLDLPGSPATESNAGWGSRGALPTKAVEQLSAQSPRLKGRRRGTWGAKGHPPSAQVPATHLPPATLQLERLSPKGCARVTCPPIGPEGGAGHTMGEPHWLNLSHCRTHWPSPLIDSPTQSASKEGSRERSLG